MRHDAMIDAAPIGPKRLTPIAAGARFLATVETAKLELLKSLTFGQRVAEEESAALAKYFVETDEWRRLFLGAVDVVYGPKGAGKSALYSLLLSRDKDLRNRSIYVVAAENPRGATAFQELQTDPPPTEPEFVSLWKMYVLSLVGDLLKREGLDDPDSKRVIDALTESGLLRGDRTLRILVRAIADYIARLLRPKAIEGELKLDPHTQLPVGFGGKIVFREPSSGETSRGLVSAQSLLEAANRALHGWGCAAWILIDRLDVAFADTPQLEEDALRALFKTYLDLHGEENIRLKIFLRSDIWERIAKGGFREASHITRTLTIKWDRPSLLNLIVRRALQNEPLRAFYGVDVEASRASDDERLRFFHRMFHDQVDVGSNKPDTVDWILSRTRDGTGKTAPREVVHLLNSVRDVQLRKLELGATPPEDTRLFARTSLKEALPEVSKVRLEQTIYAEHPNLKARIEALRKEKSTQLTKSLERIWRVDEADAISIAEELVTIGVFERRVLSQAVRFVYEPPTELSCLWLARRWRYMVAIVRCLRSESCCCSP